MSKIVTLLNPWAKREIEAQGKLLFEESVSRKYPDGRIEITTYAPVFNQVIKKELFTFIGKDGQEQELRPFYKFIFPCGKVFYEAFQCRLFFPDNTEVCLHGLKDKDFNWVQDSCWTPEQIFNLMKSSTPQS